MVKILAGGSTHRSQQEYEAWRGMRQRCLNPNFLPYKNYGGRGIKICDRWLQSYQNFLDDMGRKPGADYSLDRIDNNRGYYPDNCRWATKSEQRRNQRSRNGEGTLGTVRFKNNPKWYARIWFDKQQILIASFQDREEANAAFLSVYSQLYGIDCG